MHESRHATFALTGCTPEHRVALCMALIIVAHVGRCPPIPPVSGIEVAGGDLVETHAAPKRPNVSGLRAIATSTIITSTIGTAGFEPATP